MADIAIRPAEPDDAAAVQAIACHPEVVRWLGGTGAETVEGWRQRLSEANPADVHRLVAVEGERLVGIVELSIPPRSRTRHLAQLWLAVHPERHRQRIGTRLLAAATELADRWLGLVRLELNVLADHEVAIVLYRRAGFEVEARRRWDMLRDGALVDGLSMGRIRPGFRQPDGAARPAPAPPPRRSFAGTLGVRPVSPADAAAFGRLHRSDSVMWGTMQVPTSTESWRKRLAANDPATTHLIAIEVDGVVVGAGGLFGSAQPRLRHKWHLGMAVDPAYQGMGVGDRLMTALVEHATSFLAVLRLELEVYPDNDRAVRLYEKHAFVREGVRRFGAWRDGGYADCVCYARLFPGPRREP